MTSGYLFLSPERIRPVDSLSAPLTVEQAAAERSIFSEDLKWCAANATPVVGRMLSAICADMVGYRAPEGMHLVVDVRVQRLMPGMFASIPGWHGDAVPRASYHDQPDLSLVNVDVKHWIMHVSTGDVGGTEFLAHPCRIQIEDGDSVWKQAHRGVLLHRPETYEAKRGEVVCFGQDALHRCVPTRERGWRILVRVATMPTPPLLGGFAEQQQVYVLSEENGW